MGTARALMPYATPGTMSGLGAIMANQVATRTLPDTLGPWLSDDPQYDVRGEEGYFPDSQLGDGLTNEELATARGGCYTPTRSGWIAPAPARLPQPRQLFGAKERKMYPYASFLGNPAVALYGRGLGQPQPAAAAQDPGAQALQSMVDMQRTQLWVGIASASAFGILALIQIVRAIRGQ
jgi:hypothetical protein